MSEFGKRSRLASVKHQRDVAWLFQRRGGGVVVERRAISLTRDVPSGLVGISVHTANALRGMPARRDLLPRNLYMRARKGEPRS